MREYKITRELWELFLKAEKFTTGDGGAKYPLHRIAFSRTDEETVVYSCDGSASAILKTSGGEPCEGFLSKDNIKRLKTDKTSNLLFYSDGEKYIWKKGEIEVEDSRYYSYNRGNYKTFDGRVFEEGPMGLIEVYKQYDCHEKKREDFYEYVFETKTLKSLINYYDSLSGKKYDFKEHLLSKMDKEPDASVISNKSLFNFCSSYYNKLYKKTIFIFDKKDNCFVEYLPKYEQSLRGGLAIKSSFHRNELLCKSSIGNKKLIENDKFEWSLPFRYFVLNLDYLKLILKNITSSTLTFLFIDTLSPVIVEANDNERYIVMPMKLTKEDYLHYIGDNDTVKE